MTLTKLRSILWNTPQLGFSGFSDWGYRFWGGRRERCHSHYILSRLPGNVSNWWYLANVMFARLLKFLEPSHILSWSNLLNPYSSSTSLKEYVHTLEFFCTGDVPLLPHLFNPITSMDSMDIYLILLGYNPIRHYFVTLSHCFSFSH